MQQITLKIDRKTYLARKLLDPQHAMYHMNQSKGLE